MKTLVSWVIALFLAPCGIAAELSKSALIEEVLVVTDAKATLEMLRVDNVAHVRKIMLEDASDPIRRRILTTAVEKYDAYSKDFMGWARWEKEYVSVYDELFTESELAGLLAFYKTDAGKAAIRSLPKIGMRMQQRMVEASRNTDARIQQIIQEAMAEFDSEAQKETAAK